MQQAGGRSVAGMRTLPHNVLTHGPTTRSTLTIRAVHRCPLHRTRLRRGPCGEEEGQGCEFPVDDRDNLWVTGRIGRFGHSMSRNLDELLRLSTLRPPPDEI